MLSRDGYYVSSEDVFKGIDPKEYAFEHLKKQKENEETVISDDYMDWLCDYITTHGYACDNASFLPPHNTEKDGNNINLLSYLYMVVDKYALNNLLYDDSSYNIRYKGSIIELRLDTHQGGMCYASYNDLAERVIDFESVRNNEPNPKKEEIVAKLNAYKTYLKGLLSEDIPLVVLQENFDDAVEEYKMGKEKCKKLGV